MLLLPIVGFTPIRSEAGWGISTLTVNNGNFKPTANVVLKDIRLAHPALPRKLQYLLPDDTYGLYYKTDLTIQTGVLADINITGEPVLQAQC